MTILSTRLLEIVVEDTTSVFTVGSHTENLLSVKGCTAVLQVCETVPKSCRQHSDPAYSVLSKAEFKFLHTI